MPTTTTLNSDLIVYNQLAQTAYFERVQDVLEIFNASSQGALVLRNEMVEGDLSQDAIYTVPDGIGHRNVNSVAAANAKKLGADEIVGVKSPWKYGPYRTTEEAFKRRARNLEEFSQIIGQHAADSVLDYQVQAAFASLEAAIGGNQNMVASGAWAADGKKLLTKGMRRFGDRFSRISLFAMDSTTYFDLVDDAIDEKIFEEAGFVIYGGTPGTMGVPVLVSDKVPEDSIFGLQSGAIEIVESQAPGFRFYSVDGLENLTWGYQSEGVFNVELLGYSWNYDGSPAAPANPDLTQLGTGANWRKYADSDKATAGVLIEITQPSPVE